MLKVTHIIARSALLSFWQKHPNAQPALQGWYEQTKHAQWQNFAELRVVFPSADQVKNLTVFNIGGNNYRLIAFVDYTYKELQKKPTYFQLGDKSACLKVVTNEQSSEIN